MAGRSRRRSGSTLGSLTATAVTALVLLTSVGIASAHGAVGGGVDVPIPLWLLYGGSGVTVALTAGWLAVGNRQARPGWAGRAITLPHWLGQTLANLAHSIGLFALFAVVLGGLFGPQVQSENVATVLFWPVWLKGLGLVAILAGSPWHVVSPWETIYDVLAWLEGEDPAIFGSYPDRLGVWPALIGFLFVVGVVENLTTLPRSPRLTAALVAGYALVMVVGALTFGREWFRRGDLFAVLYRLLGRVAPLTVTRADEHDRIGLRLPWTACTHAVPSKSVVAFAVAAVYTVSFDGLTNTPVFQTALTTLGSGVGPTPMAIALYVVGFVLFVASYQGAVWAVDLVGGPRGVTATGLTFAGSVLPIAAAYEVAHTYPFVLRNLGTLVELATGGVLTPSLVGWIPVAGFWTSQLALIVGGHLVAVVAAHAVATDRYGPRAGRRAHVPMVVVMVGYTVLSLWIISQPVVA